MSSILPSRGQEEFVQYKAAEKEETFEELEERIESIIYEANKALREGQKESMLLESEMRSLQFRVYQET